MDSTSIAKPLPGGSLTTMVDRWSGSLQSGGYPPANGRELIASPGSFCGCAFAKRRISSGFAGRAGCPSNSSGNANWQTDTARCAGGQRTSFRPIIWPSARLRTMRTKRCRLRVTEVRMLLRTAFRGPSFLFYKRVDWMATWRLPITVPKPY